MSSDLIALREKWQAVWPNALLIWTRFPRLPEPRWCLTPDEAAAEGLEGSFAMIRLADQAIVVSLAQVRDLGLEDFAQEILAHEIGHHILCPASVRDHVRGLVVARHCLPGQEPFAPMVSNLFTDLLINDRLQRSSDLKVAEVYARLPRGASDDLWRLYQRTYELLWSLAAGTLTAPLEKAEIETDARLAARVVRVYADHWLTGLGRFAALVLPYLQAGAEACEGRCWSDTRGAAAGCEPHGLTDLTPEEQQDVLHPAFDPLVTGGGKKAVPQGVPEDTAGQTRSTAGNAQGQSRPPFEYGALLRSLGLDLDDHQAAVRYYRERALPHLIRFPLVRGPSAAYQQPEGLDRWDAGDPLEELDWFQSTLISPVIIPGYTTVERVYGEVEDIEQAPRPPDLDLYVDCSGSMPNPQRNLSHITLAGAIVALSALRAGARVQATLWSGPGQFETTHGFVREDTPVLQVLTGYLGGSTAFPLHVLRETFLEGPPPRTPVHILVLSDDGADTMFKKDEQGHAGEELCRRALTTARGGGTLALNLPSRNHAQAFIERAEQQGWDVFPVTNWEELIAFAKAFSQRTFGLDHDAPRRTHA